jgi:hypothetical protein
MMHLEYYIKMHFGEIGNGLYLLDSSGSNKVNWGKRKMLGNYRGAEQLAAFQVLSSSDLVLFVTLPVTPKHFGSHSSSLGLSMTPV